MSLCNTHHFSGATARQRVALPNDYFHPCEDSDISFLKGDHSVSGRKPCWRCYVCYFCSSAPLQGFEFEASLIVNSAIFNIVEVMPVMPGPCQLLNWKEMKRFKVGEFQSMGSVRSLELDNPRILESVTISAVVFLSCF